MILFSIGYQGKSLDSLCSTLAENRVEVIVDVRERAWSNRPEFRKTALAEGLGRLSIAYVHVKVAGNPFRPKKGSHVQSNICMKLYEEYLSKRPEIIDSVIAASGGRRAALFCYEAETGECHRGVLIAAIVSSNPDLGVVHL